MEIDFPFPCTARIFGAEPEVKKIAHGLVAELYSNFSVSFPQKFDTSAEFILKEVRQGAFVFILNGKLRLMLLLVNRTYKSPFKQPNLANFWANQHILCNKPEPMGWGTGMIKEYVEFLNDVCCRFQPSNTAFILNRRDCPLLRKDGSHCYEVTAECSCKRSYMAETLLPVFSLFTGHDWLDYPLPDITSTTNRQVVWEHKLPCIFFAGSSTGKGKTAATNDRIWFCEWARTQPLDEFDLRIVKWSDRLQLDKNEIIGTEQLWTPDPYVPAHKWSEWKFLLYIQGYSAALRYRAMLFSGSVIIRAAPRKYTGMASELWFFDQLISCKPGETEVGNADHVLIFSPEELPFCLSWLRSNDKLAEKLVANAHNLAQNLDNQQFFFDVLSKCDTAIA